MKIRCNMKLLLTLLVVIPLARGFTVQEPEDAQFRSISSQIVDAIEAAKAQMPCGFPALGIPPLAPLTIPHKQVNISLNAFKAQGEIEGFRLDGLDDFDIVQLNFNAVLSRVNFKFNWNLVYFNTDYEMSTSVDNFQLKRQGTAKIALRNLTVWGTIRYSLGLISGSNVRVKSFDLYVSLEHVKSEITGLSKYSIINRKLNEVIEEWIMLAINDNTNNISELTNGYVVPLANGLIGDMSLTDLLALIGGIGGGDDPVPCVPEELSVVPFKIFK